MTPQPEGDAGLDFHQIDARIVSADIAVGEMEIVVGDAIAHAIRYNFFQARAEFRAPLQVRALGGEHTVLEIQNAAFANEVRLVLARLTPHRAKSDRGSARSILLLAM